MFIVLEGLDGAGKSTVEAVDPYLVALLFAGDRGDAAAEIRQWLASGEAVVLDRYVYSNVAFQCAKLSSEEERRALKRWILDTEYGYYRLPRPDVSLFLDVPFSFTERKLTQAREGGDRDYLQGVYLDAAREDAAFRVVDCCAPDGSMETPERIFSKIEAALAPLLNAAADA